MRNKLTTEEFIRRSREVHGDKYDYSNVTYVNAKTTVEIICKKCGKIFWQFPFNHLKGHGCTYCGLSINNGKANQKLRKKIYGVGVYDAPYPRNKDEHTKRIYRVWTGILERCYGKRQCDKMRSYYGCTICKEWESFLLFREWYENNHIEGCNIDKDLFSNGEKIYSPDTCCFVPQEINLLLVKRKALRGECPIGVTKRRNGKYVAQMQKYGKLQSLGTYLTKDDAFYVYKKAKEEYIKEVAQKYFDEGKITERVYDTLIKYEVEITD